MTWLTYTKDTSKKKKKKERIKCPVCDTRHTRVLIAFECLKEISILKHSYTQEDIPTDVKNKFRATLRYMRDTVWREYNG